MSDGGLKVLNGADLSAAAAAADFRLPDKDGEASLNGERVLQLAESKTSELLCGLRLPETLKSSAVRRIDLDPLDNFRGKTLDKEEASQFFRSYISGIAEVLRDDPIVVAILDGKVLKMLMEDEDDFAMLAENLFTDLDTEDDGKLSKRQIRTALEVMGPQMGVPPASEFPQLNDILKKHGTEEGEEKLGQAQFAQLLQPVLQELADALSEKHVIAVQNVKVLDGYKLKKLLGNETQLSAVIEEIYQAEQVETLSKEKVRTYLEKNGKELGLPHLSEAKEAVTLLLDSAFANLDKGKGTNKKLERKDFGELVKDILNKCVEQLEVNPIFLE